METAKVRKLRLYDARHAALTYLAMNGVPDTIVSAWAGHRDLSLAKRVYIHPSAKDLEQASDKFAVLLGWLLDPHVRFREIREVPDSSQGPLTEVIRALTWPCCRRDDRN
jgi:hypothetical protein